MAKPTTHAGLVREVASLKRRLAELRQGGRSRVWRIEHDLKERVKELDCLYTISRLRELHFHSPDKFLQSVVDCLPGSWQYPQDACARIVYGDRRYVTKGFREGHWRMAATISENDKPAGIVEVFYPRLPADDADNPFLAEEHSLITAVAERVSSVMMHIQSQESLREAHKALQREHQSLREMNMALRAVLSRLEEEKREIRASILSNIQNILMPIVFELELEVTGRQRSYVTLLRQNLQEIASPFLTQLARNNMALSPVEISISTMIRNGLSTKEIAQLRCITPATVRRHRENIRRKLSLRNRKVNLVTYLQSAGSEEPAHAEQRLAELADQKRVGAERSLP